MVGYVRRSANFVKEERREWEWLNDRSEMAFFKGLYDGKLDAKGRMVLPSRLKSNVPESDQGQLVIQKALKEKCLILQSQSAFEKKMERVNRLNEFNSTHRRLQRQLMSICADTELDGNGRFLIPKSMIDWAELEKDIVVIGVKDWIELWRPSNYEAYQNQMADEEFNKLAEDILGDANDLLHE